MSQLAFLVNPAFWSGAAQAAAVVGAGTGIASAVGAFDRGGKDISLPTLNLPKSPAITTDKDIKQITEEEKSKIRRGKIVRQTLMTGPRGLLEPAPVGKKTLLGG